MVFRWFFVLNRRMKAWRHLCAADTEEMANAWQWELGDSILLPSTAQGRLRMRMGENRHGRSTKPGDPSHFRSVWKCLQKQTKKMTLTKTSELRCKKTVTCLPFGKMKKTKQILRLSWVGCSWNACGKKLLEIAVTNSVVPREALATNFGNTPRGRSREHSKENTQMLLTPITWSPSAIMIGSRHVPSPPTSLSLFSLFSLLFFTTLWHYIKGITSSLDKSRRDMKMRSDNLSF